MTGPYGRAARALTDRGWRAIPADVGQRGRTVRGVTGYEGEDLRGSRLDAFIEKYGEGNIGIVMPKNVIALDVDGKDGKDGASLSASLRDGWPATYSNGHGDPSSPYRHFFYRVPDSVTPEDVASLGPGRDGIDVLRWMHRWSRCAPSVHESGEVYYWTDPEGKRCKTPSPSDLPQLSDEQWAEVVEVFGSSVKGRYAVADVDVEEWISEHDGKADSAVREAVAAHWGRADGAAGTERHGSHYAAVVAAQQALAHLGEEGHPVGSALAWLKVQYLTYAEGVREDAEGEWERGLGGAIGKAVSKTAAYELAGPEIEAFLARRKAQPRAVQHGADPYNFLISGEPVEFTRQYLIRHFNGTLRYFAGFWRWSEKRHHWVEVSDDQMRAWVQDHLRGAQETDLTGDVRLIQLKMKNVNEVLAAAKGLVYREPEVATGGVPFEDGWLDMRTGELLPLTPERFHTWCVPATYSGNKGCKGWLSFLESVGWGPETEEYRLLRQWLGYVLSGDNDLQKALLLHGPTRSGKGVILALAHYLLGDGATGLQLSALAGEFGLQPLLGKSLAVIGDARFTAKVDKTVVERLLSLIGKDAQAVNVKNKPQVSTRLPTRLMIATNERPIFTESSDALARRFLILHMTRSFLGHEDLNLEDRLKDEAAGIAAWALDGYRDLKSSRRFSETAVGREMVEEFVRDSAPIRHFVDQMCEIGEGFRVPNDDLYRVYDLWCAKNGVHPLNGIHFVRELHTAYEGQIESGRTKTVRFQQGLRLR